MSKTVTCSLCGGPVDDADTVEMPNGPMCMQCYEWIEGLMDEADEDEEQDEFEVTIYFEEWEEE